MRSRRPTPVKVRLDFAKLEPEDAADADGAQLAAVDEAIDRADAAVEECCGLRSGPELNYVRTRRQHCLCMTHIDSVQPERASLGNSDRRGRGNSDRVPLLLEGKVDRPHLERMQRYCEDVRRDGYSGDRLGMSAACEAVISYVQAALAKLAPGPLPPHVATELVVPELWALHALIDWKGKAAAKREQVRLASGAPLSVCRGGGKDLVVETLLGPRTVQAAGCLRIFELPMRSSGGKMWASLCPDCRPSNGRRQPLRSAARAAKARAEEIHRLRQAG